ncbi:MAG TPA: hypothetical protein DGH25_01050 [Erwiniaceae bacterium]|nr:hypothetical protein [Erwiniaceae bacterium]
MSVQHLLISRDGKNEIIEKEKLVSHLVIGVKVQSTSTGMAPTHAGRHVEVKAYPYKGKSYAVSIERNTDNHEIERIIEEMGLQPIPE